VADKIAIADAGELGVADTGALAHAAACALGDQASVVHNCVQDQASLMRGRMSVAAPFGTPIAIYVSNLFPMAAFRTLAEVHDDIALTLLFVSRGSDIVAGLAEGFSPSLEPTMARARYVALVETKAGAVIRLPVKAVAMLGGLGADDIRGTGRFACAAGAAYQITDDVAPELARGELNGVLVKAICSDDPVRAGSLRMALTHAAEKGIATQDKAALSASLRPATEATVRWRDQLFAEAMKALAGHPLRRVLLNAVMALAPSTQAPAMGSQHAA
jgi:geranylgeranyl pyrophosphate synthase